MFELSVVALQTQHVFMSRATMIAHPKLRVLTWKFASLTETATKSTSGSQMALEANTKSVATAHSQNQSGLVGKTGTSTLRSKLGAIPNLTNPSKASSAPRNVRPRKAVSSVGSGKILACVPTSRCYSQNSGCAYVVCTLIFMWF